VYNNENNQFNSFFDLKNNLINEIASQRIALVNSNVVIKDISTVVNIKNTKGVNNKFKFILPVLFIFLFIVFAMVNSLYKKQKARFLNSIQ
jgi:hypothetical protein